MTDTPSPTTVERTDVLTYWPAHALAELLDLSLPELVAPAGLPLLWHWLYPLDSPAQRAHGPDGHPSHGIPEPPGPWLQRIFGGGAVTKHRPLPVGEPATRLTTVTGTETKPGRSGPLTFVTVRNQIHQRDGLALVDEQRVVYREQRPVKGGNAAPRLSAPAALRGRREVQIDPVLLFRFPR